MRTLKWGISFNASLISKAHCTGASGFVKKTSAIPSPTGSRTSLLAAFGGAELLRIADDLIQLLLQLALIVDQQFRVADDVDEKNVANCELNIGCGSRGHAAFFIAARII